jgi:hypothetical protein
MKRIERLAGKSLCGPWLGAHPLPVGLPLPAPGARVEVEFNLGAYAGTVGRAPGRAALAHLGQGAGRSPSPGDTHFALKLSVTQSDI